ncbi:MAG: hypothetical protein HKN58_03535 [Xanthomonadales bacterium]|nr:hypothetical protein [Xanthomonadales bacterium]
MQQWKPFPHDDTSFTYAGKALATAWPALHRGDCEPYPDEAWAAELLHAHPHAAPEDFDGDLGGLAQSLRSAWRAFHAGRFQQAVTRAEACGSLGAACANKATGIYASSLEDDDSHRQACFESAIERAEQAVNHLPDAANSHYFLAFNLGRLSQSMSVMDALRQGLGGRIKSALETTLELERHHADAHIALGMYHAEVINKVGKMIGSMTYGASAAQAVEHFERALELNPESPIAHIEYGNGLYLLHGDREIDKVTELYVKASEMTPRDAMEQLDIEAALAELE